MNGEINNIQMQKSSIFPVRMHLIAKTIGISGIAINNPVKKSRMKLSTSSKLNLLISFS